MTSIDMPDGTADALAGTDDRMSRFYSTGLDVSSRAGFLLGAFYTGLSFQPNLLSRGTRDQAIISGVAASVGYAWGSSAHSFLRSTADRMPMSSRSTAGHAVSGLIVDVAAAAVGAVIMKAVPPREHESSKRALIRLGGVGLAAAGLAGVGADSLEPTRGKRGFHAAGAATALATTVGAYLLTRPGTATRGALAPGETEARENVVREVSIPKALGSSLAVTAVLFAVAKGESALSGGVARGAAKVLGGYPDDHRTIGRFAATAALAGVGWGAVAAANTVLGKAGVSADIAHENAPTVPEITGGPGSVVPWTDQTRESRRWLTMTLRPDEIEAVMGEPATQPIRVYAPLQAATTPEERADLLLAEIDRTGALERPAFALFSPTGSGYVNYVATETFEYLTRGNCASASIQYSVLPSALSLTKVDYATHQTRILVNGIVARLMAMPADKRPKFYLFGESLGSQVSEEMFRGTGTSGPSGIGLDAAFWIGTPASTVWRQEMWGTRTVSEAPEVGPGPFYLPRAIRDWDALPAEEKDQGRVPPAAERRRPRAEVRGTARVEAARLARTGRHPSARLAARHALAAGRHVRHDLHRPAERPRPHAGLFQEGGHDYRLVIPETLRQVFRLEANADQMERVQAALRARELAWEVRRRWDKAQAAPSPDRAAAEQKVLDSVSTWTGRDITREDVESIAASA